MITVYDLTTPFKLSGTVTGYGSQPSEHSETLWIGSSADTLVAKTVVMAWHGETVVFTSTDTFNPGTYYFKFSLTNEDVVPNVTYESEVQVFSPQVVLNGLVSGTCVIAQVLPGAPTPTWEYVFAATPPGDGVQQMKIIAPVEGLAVVGDTYAHVGASGLTVG